MYAYHDVQALHLEPTTACNARCPMCARNESGGSVNPRLKITHLGRQNIEDFFPIEFRKNLKRLLLCGNFGDPVAAPEIIEILQLFREANPEVKIHLNSNGGLRTTEIWKRLAGLVDRCAFGIDGLEDTNHLYRQGVSWQRLMENVSAFISNGGQAEWHFLIFAHNENQVDQAEELSRRLGFIQFQAKVTSRFFKSQSGSVESDFAVLNSEGKVTHYLSPPQQARFQNKALKQVKQVDWNNYLKNCQIRCRVQEERSIYVSATGEVFPCCWLGQEPWLSGFERIPGNLTEFLRHKGLTTQALSLYHHKLDDILAGPIFQVHVPKSWSAESTDGRLRTCAKTCGQQLDFFDSQFVKAEEPRV